MINTRLYEEGVLADLKAGLLSPEAISEYVREYHRDFAHQAANLGRDRARVERKLHEAERKKERMLKAFAEGGSEFAEIRTMLAAARDEADRLQRELASMDALPNVLALHPHVEEQYRKQVEELSAALSTPEAQPEAISRYRAMIARVIVSPDSTKQRGAVVQVVRQMDEVLSLATERHALA